MRAIDALRRHKIGQDFAGDPIYAGPNFRLFFLLLIAGGRTVVLNATFKRGVVDLNGGNVIIAGCKFMGVEK
jgi:hypothetical protein